ncbi:MAG: hypothetical protein ABID54_04615 [Pseudomonadota bacterium]
MAENYRHNIAEALTRYSSSKKDIPQPTQTRLLNEDTSFFSSLTPISQVKNTYILCTYDEGLILVDQHAAHERVIFESLREGYLSSRIASQRLLVPQRIELSYKEARFLEEYLNALLEVGLEIEPFGGNTIIIKSAPEMLIDSDYRQLMLDIIDELHSYGKSLQFEESIENILMLMACHAAIKANQHLSLKEIETLLQQLDRAGSPTNCPHGRPILRKIPYKEIDRMFKRG